MKYRLNYKDENGKIVKGALLYPVSSKKALEGMKDTLNKKHSNRHYFIETAYDEPQRLESGFSAKKLP